MIENAYKVQNALIRLLGPMTCLAQHTLVFIQKQEPAEGRLQIRAWPKSMFPGLPKIISTQCVILELACAAEGRRRLSRKVTEIEEYTHGHCRTALTIGLNAESAKRVPNTQKLPKKSELGAKRSYRFTP
jgi:hypothetical protein